MRGLALLTVPVLAAAVGVGLYGPADLATELKHGWVATASRLQASRLYTADEVAVWPQVQNPLGVNTFLEQEADPAVRRRSLELIRAAGIRWVRQQFRWEEIEPRRSGEYTDPNTGGSSWEKYDHIVALAAEMGVEVIARVDTAPAWARGGTAPDGRAPPVDARDWERFVGAVAQRYRGRVGHYQIWNEPNLTIEWGRQPVDPAAYTRLLEAGYRAIKAADPGAAVLAAALAPTLDETPEALNELVFLQRMYDAGARRFFDILSVNAYGLRGGPDDLRLGLDDVNFSRPLRVREVMVLNGDARKPVWASEMGWNAAPSDLPGPNEYGRVSPRLQARYTVRAYERARQEWPWMGVMAIWYFKRPDGRDQEQAWYYFRMMEPDFTPLPLYHAIQGYARERGYLPGGG